ncbi:hypothetical protein AKO1_014125 [Acrasis kona]|uniref:Protein kinase domain-containing protein n=1 Tax=Acrasis kona TaxID=1008807 RepID=A0AAW2Z0Y4_9EUKA
MITMLNKNDLSIYMRKKANMNVTDPRGPKFSGYFKNHIYYTIFNTVYHICDYDVIKDESICHKIPEADDIGIVNTSVMKSQTEGALFVGSVIAKTVSFFTFNLLRRREDWSVVFELSKFTDAIYSANINPALSSCTIFGVKKGVLQILILYQDRGYLTQFPSLGTGLDVQSFAIPNFDYKDQNDKYFITVSQYGMVNRVNYKYAKENFTIGAVSGVNLNKKLVGTHIISESSSVILASDQSTDLSAEGVLFFFDISTMYTKSSMQVKQPHDSAPNSVLVMQNGKNPLLVYNTREVIAVVNTDNTTWSSLARLDINDPPLIVAGDYPFVEIVTLNQIKLYNAFDLSLIQSHTTGPLVLGTSFACGVKFQGNYTILSADGYDMLLLHYNGTSYNQRWFKVDVEDRLIVGTTCYSLVIRNSYLYAHGANRRGNEVVTRFEVVLSTDLMLGMDVRYSKENTIQLQGSGVSSVVAIDESLNINNNYKILIYTSISGVVSVFDVSDPTYLDNFDPKLFYILLSALVFVIFLLILVCIFAVLYIRIVWRTRVQRKKNDELYNLLEERLMDAGTNHLKGLEWVIKIEDLTFEQRISEGTFGIVFKGKYRGGNVAIKKLKLDGDYEFEHEVEILSRLRHPNIVLFMGVCFQEDYKLIVTEYLHNKSVDQFLYRKDDGGSTPTTPSVKERSGSMIRHKGLQFSKKIEILIDVIKGMLYLHSHEPNAIIHRDLKTSNILLDEHFTAKVCDFGQSRFAEIGAAATASMTSNIGTTQYMAPEIILDLPYNEKCDVYSFGIVMYEILFERQPFQTDEPDAMSTRESGVSMFPSMIALSIEVAQKGRRPVVPVDVNMTAVEEQYVALMQLCWRQDPNERPSFKEVFEKLLIIQESSV